MKTIFFSLILFLGINSLAAKDIKPDIIIDEDSFLGSTQDGKIFSQSGKIVSAFDIGSKKTHTATCDFDTARKYQSSARKIEENIYLVQRMVNMQRTQYRVFLASGNCWSIPNSQNFSFILKVPNKDILIAGLDDKLVYLDSRNGEFIESFSIDSFGRNGASARIFDGKVFVFISKGWPVYGSVTVFDMNKKTVDSNFELNNGLSYGFTYNSDLYFVDNANAVFMLDPRNPEASFAQPIFSLHKDCNWLEFNEKNQMFLCERYADNVFSFQFMNQNEVTFPWGNESGDHAVFSSQLNKGLKAKGNWLSLFDMATGTFTKSYVSDYISGLFMSASGEFYVGGDGGIYAIDAKTGQPELQFKYTSFSGNHSSGPYPYWMAGDLLVHRAHNFSDNTVAFYSVKLK